jgi:hypothetical protein
MKKMINPLYFRVCIFISVNSSDKYREINDCNYMHTSESKKWKALREDCCNVNINSQHPTEDSNHFPSLNLELVKQLNMAYNNIIQWNKSLTFDNKNFDLDTFSTSPSDFHK